MATYMSKFRLCHKEIETKDGRKFPTYFGYFCDEDEGHNLVKRTYTRVDDNGNIQTITYPSVKVVFPSDVMDKVRVANIPFPVYIDVDLKARKDDGSRKFYLGYDYNKEGTPRVDDEGHRRFVLICYDVPTDYTKAEALSLSLEDMED